MTPEPLVFEHRTVRLCGSARVGVRAQLVSCFGVQQIEALTRFPPQRLCLCFLPERTEGRPGEINRFQRLTGDSVRARAVSAGGESGDPRSPHFNDQALRYSTGDLRQVYFYPSQLRGHTERVYHPGG